MQESLFVFITVIMYWSMLLCGFLTDSVRYCRGNTLEQRIDALEKKALTGGEAAETDPMIAVDK
jgi:hypothetical protein